MREFVLELGLGIGAACQWRELLASSWEGIERELYAIRDISGTITLKNRNPPDEGPQSLQLQCESGRYLLTMAVVENDEYDVKSFTNLAANVEKVEVLGELWDSKMICFDFLTVVYAFKEFFETENLSTIALT